MKIFDNPEVSLQAKGLFMVFYESLVENNGKITQNLIQEKIKEGVQGFRTPYNELRRNGYLTVTRTGKSEYSYRLIIDPEESEGQ